MHWKWTLTFKLIFLLSLNLIKNFKSKHIEFHEMKFNYVKFDGI